MNETARLRLLPALFMALGLAACSPAAEAPPLKGARIGGPFTLTDQGGREVSERDFAGTYRIVYFGFTSCPDVCPTDLQRIAQALRALEKSDPRIAAEVQPIFVTVDPERDTPAVMKRYVSAFHPRIVGLTGTPEQVADAARRYGIFYAKEEQAGAGGYTMSHNRIVYLFGPKGEPIAILPHDEGVAAIAAELRRWVV